MTLRDRGKLKWLPAHFMPEHRSELRKLDSDFNRQAKPILNEYKREDFEQRICYAKEFNLPVVIIIWADGFSYEEKGFVHYLDPIGKQLRLKAVDGTGMRIKFVDIIGVEVFE